MTSVKIIIQKSDKADKKYVAIINNKKHIYFGATGYEDYTTHQDDKRKENYIKRHSKTENWNNYESAGFFSRWILWNQKTVSASIKDIERRYPNLKIQLK